MAFMLAENWWAIALRGVCGILFGAIALMRPGVAIAALVFLFGIYALFDGIFSLVSAIRGGRNQPRWGMLLLRGIIGILVGIYAFVSPGITALALVTVVAVWAVITGILEIAAAIRLRKVIRNEWLMGLAGAVSVIFGVLLLAAPLAGAVVLAWWIGTYALIMGVVEVALGFKLRRIGRIEDSGERQQPLAA
jgi:uncharacterized membrane protein HdeD (DUF308 family)